MVYDVILCLDLDQLMHQSRDTDQSDVRCSHTGAALEVWRSWRWSRSVKSETEASEKWDFFPRSRSARSTWRHVQERSALLIRQVNCMGSVSCLFWPGASLAWTSFNIGGLTSCFCHFVESVIEAHWKLIATVTWLILVSYVMPLSADLCRLFFQHPRDKCGCIKQLRGPELHHVTWLISDSHCYLRSLISWQPVTWFWLATVVKMRAGVKFKYIRFVYQWVLITLGNNLCKFSGNLTFRWWEIGCQRCNLKRAALHFCENFLATGQLYLSCILETVYRSWQLIFCAQIIMMYTAGFLRFTAEGRAVFCHYTGLFPDDRGRSG